MNLSCDKNQQEKIGQKAIYKANDILEIGMQQVSINFGQNQVQPNQFQSTTQKWSTVKLSKTSQSSYQVGFAHNKSSLNMTPS